jgi:hypothetical protein
MYTTRNHTKSAFELKITIKAKISKTTGHQFCYIHTGPTAAASGSSGQIGPSYLTQLTAQMDIIEIYHTFNECYCNPEDNLMYFMIVTIFVDRHVCST